MRKILKLKFIAIFLLLTVFLFSCGSKKETTVRFGRYKQTINQEMKDIEWIVLQEDADKKLLLSKEILDCLEYDDTGDDCTWETCSLRAWLNYDFYEEVFNEEEKSKILTTTVVNEANDLYEFVIDGGADTNDKVFLLSINEVRKYFGEGEKIQSGYKIGDKITAKATDYAKLADEDGNVIVTEDENSFYWLRSPGHYPNTASVVDSKGNLLAFGYNVDYAVIGVRPVIWISK